MKRIQGQLPFRILNGGRELACLFKQQDKLPENIGILLPKTFSLLLDPLVVQTRHEIAAVQGSRFFEFSPRSNRVACLSRLQAARRTLLKSRHIDYEFRRGMPQNVLTVSAVMNCPPSGSADRRLWSNYRVFVRACVIVDVG